MTHETFPTSGEEGQDQLTPEQRAEIDSLHMRYVGKRPDFEGAYQGTPSPDEENPQSDQNEEE